MLSAPTSRSHQPRRRTPDPGAKYAAAQQTRSSHPPTDGRDELPEQLVTQHRDQAQSKAYSNAVAESFFATIKRELIYTRPWPTRAGLRHAVFEYIEGWYNTRRLHSTLGYMSPAKYEALHRNADRQAA